MHPKKENSLHRVVSLWLTFQCQKVIKVKKNAGCFKKSYWEILLAILIKIIYGTLHVALQQRIFF